MNCPICNVPLIVVERNQIEVDYCLTCNGMWLDNGEMELLAEILGIEADVVSPFEMKPIQTKEELRKCPYCRMMMKKVELNGVIVDVCDNQHGIWFDKSELSKVLNYDKNSDYGKSVKFLGEIFKKK